MYTERRYIAIFSAAVIITTAAFFFLFEKYSYTTLYFVAQQCYQSISSFFSSPFHLIGLSVFSIVIALSIIFFLKCLFSAWKTQQRMSEFARHRLHQVPQRVAALCTTHGIDLTQLIVVKNTQPLAYAMGMFQPKIVITTGLIKLLTKKELEAVLLHEKYHKVHRHGLVILCAEIISSTLSFFPLLLDILTRMKGTFELAADHHAREVQGTGRYVHAAILAVTQEVKSSYTNAFRPAFGLTVVEQRLHMLKHNVLHRQRYKKARVTWSFLSLMILTTLIFFPTQLYAAEATAQVAEGQSCSNTLQCSVQCRDARISRSEREKEAVISGLSNASIQK